ncbi:MAG: hypothetical protein IID37_00330 [Planctomycetes bacterium]|nr:hypothetical protein [Planctomycetota bacterium]
MYDNQPGRRDLALFGRRPKEDQQIEKYCLGREISCEQHRNLAAGFGSERYPPTDGHGRFWQLDAIQTNAYEPLVTVGHNEPEVMRSLDQEVVERMMGVVLPVSE